ncbi:RNA polymerase subunit sigma [Prauserella marina]|uniref:RNA polymerase sigma-70 factor, ECF subfamily n=1 Tax=Prauserella marina TaxID=530584 RepID=A0A222VPY1_9PSEU|nr:sigma-70 family RNA polymerase sigma factor [Prauserella marina]ASR35803.1 RNA polymerase subunit sigma [Prauserella marina]PWV84294.1 RNA polymerase sigma-70 factor (ECF subfamily) [Prauserella marina]SDC26035.1 RNA polymerase sigma-70 factor, ECF subfamily [Prauserella marina]
MSHSGPRDDDHITELAFAAGRGDQVAFEAWVRATQADVWRFLVHLNGRQTADDLTQETYLRAVSALPRFAGRSSARTWLLSIARRVVIDNIRRESARPRLADQDWETVADAPAMRRRDVAGDFEAVVDTRLLLDQLDPERREALILTQVLGFGYAEAAEICGCPVGTIRSRVARARDELLLVLREQGNAS